MKNILEVPYTQIRFRINGDGYKVKCYSFWKFKYYPKPKFGDFVLDIRDYSYGVHDGEFAGRIAVKDGRITEGVEVKYCRKLVKV